MGYNVSVRLDDIDTTGALDPDDIAMVTLEIGTPDGHVISHTMRMKVDDERYIAVTTEDEQRQRLFDKLPHLMPEGMREALDLENLYEQEPRETKEES